VVPSAAETAANLSAVQGLLAAGGFRDVESTAEDEALEAAAAAEAPAGEEEAAVAAREAVEKENAEIVGMRRELAMQNMAWLASEAADAAPEAGVLVRFGGQRV
jgi:hypothetical protein